MTSKRSTQGSGDRAFRVIKQDTGHRNYFGPYGTLEGAMNKRNTLAAPYFILPQHVEIWIEQTPGGWERVEAA